MSQFEIAFAVVGVLVVAALWFVARYEFRRVRAKIWLLLDERDAYEGVLRRVAEGDNLELAEAASAALTKHSKKASA